MSDTPRTDAALNIIRYDPAVPTEVHKLNALVPVARILECELAEVNKTLEAAKSFAADQHEATNRAEARITALEAKIANSGPLKAIRYAITLLEVEGNYDKALQYLREAEALHKEELS